METSQCLLILHVDEFESTIWKKKEETVYEIIEELTEEQVAEYESLFDEDEEEEAWDIEEADYDFDDEGSDDLAKV